MKTRKELATYNSKLGVFSRTPGGEKVATAVGYFMAATIAVMILTWSTALASSLYTDYQLGKEAGRLEAKAGVIEHEELPAMELEIQEAYKLIEAKKKERTRIARILEIAKCKISVIENEKTMNYDHCDSVGL